MADVTGTSSALMSANVPGIRDQFLGMDIPQVPPVPQQDVAADLINAITSLEQANMGYAQADSYYKGQQPEFFASLRLRIAMGATGVIFNFNFAKLPVDAVVERLEVAAVSSPDSSLADALNDIWVSNQLDLWAPNIMKKACLFGDAYAMVWPDDETGEPVIHYNSPRTTRVFYDSENETRKQYAIKRWRDAATGLIFINLYYPDRIEKYYVQKTTPTGKTVPMYMKRLDPGDVGWPLENPYGIVPIFHFRNNLPYGDPEHRDAYGPQDAIHKLVINHMASVDYNAFPQRYALMEDGYDTSEAAFGDEGEFAFSIDTGATLDTGIDPKAQLTADPASVWFMKGVKQYGQFQPGDPAAFLGPFKDYIHAMAVVTNTPMHFMDPIVANVSGESLRVVEAPFAKKVRNRQTIFGTAWRDVFDFALQIKGIMVDKTERAVHISWVPAATVNDLATLQGMQIKMLLRVPPSQILSELGYTPEQLLAWKVETMPVILEEEQAGMDQPGTSEEL